MGNVQACPKCGQNVQPDELFCPYCGHRMDKPLNASTGFRCKVCGANNAAGMAFCTACGTPANQSGRAQAEVSPGVHGAAGAASVRTCPGCGHKNTGEMMFCDNCGMLLPENATETPSRPAEEKAVLPKAEARTKTGYPPKPVIPQKPAASSPQEPAKASIDDWFTPAPQSAPAAGAAKPVPMQTPTESSAAGGIAADDDWGAVVPAKKAGLSNLRKGLIIGGVALAAVILIVILIVVLGGGSDSKETFVPEPTITATVEPTESPTPTPTPTPTPSPTPSPTPCPHISEYKDESQRYHEPIAHDNQNHTLIIVYDRKCRVCEDTLPATRDCEEKSQEPHSYSGNTCTACGYVKPEPSWLQPNNRSYSKYEGASSEHYQEYGKYLDEPEPKLKLMLDGDINTRFGWLSSISNYQGGQPQFSFFFDDIELASVEIRTGDLSSERNYFKHGRLIKMTLVIYCDEGKLEEDVEIYDKYSEEFQVRKLKRSYTGVTRIDITYDASGRVKGNGNVNFFYITDIKFMGYPAQDQK